MSSQDSNKLKNDPFYIPTVPMYRDLGADDLNDTIGDQFFDLVTDKLQLSPTGNKPTRKSLLKPGRPSITNSVPPSASATSIQSGIRKENSSHESRYRTQNCVPVVSKTTMNLRSSNKTESVSTPDKIDIKTRTPSTTSRTYAINDTASSGQSRISKPSPTIRPSPRSKPSVMTPTPASIQCEFVSSNNKSNLSRESSKINASTNQQRTTRRSLLRSDRPSIMCTVAHVEKVLTVAKGVNEKDNQTHQSRFKTLLVNPLGRPRPANKKDSSSLTSTSIPNHAPPRLSSISSSINDTPRESRKTPRSISVSKSVSKNEPQKALRSSSAVSTRGVSSSSGSMQVNQNTFGFMAPTASSARRDNPKIQVMDGIPEDVIAKLRNYNTALTKFEDILEEFLCVPYTEQNQRPPLEKARTDLASLFTLNSLYWSYLACDGKNPKNDEELEVERRRVKEYFTKLKQFDEQILRPKVNQRASKAFVRNALFDVNVDSSSSALNASTTFDNDDWDDVRTTGNVRKDDEKDEPLAKKSKHTIFDDAGESGP
ncbi:nuclear nucleic acid-binding protein C1D [Ditylenchus destructor]|uniref:Nuclear nucleic acid-binding protein C1D n=1 Tax=Ditylenchus destructor TaxID=166010 RepID=A0AAD4NFY3_9BILA|nr:nuclear nucleic acid-binding protein C1D [Ditylenchus destructor]KAI1728663.1 nuclear nucleic acid-binding protein C1D [Ditylenchus destructor]